MTPGAAVRGGLGDPVFGSQAIFRTLMHSVAEPGRIAEIGAEVAAPAPLAPAAAAILAALADADTPVWLPDPAGGWQAAAAWLRFQTGAPVTADRAAACFAVLPEGDDPAGWDDFALGTAEDPHRSATLLLPVAALSDGGALVLEGPGIARRRIIAPAGLPDGFLAAMRTNRARFPRGFDLVLVQGRAALALPRTTRIAEA